MDLSCTAPDLRHLDAREAELMLCGVFADERPMHGLAGLVGWRLAGMIDRLLETGFFSGSAGETLLVPVPDNGHARRLIAFDAATEEETGVMLGVQRIIGASSDLALLRDTAGDTILAELPSLGALSIPEADAIEAAELVAFSRHGLWVVAHGGRSLSALTGF